MQVFRVQRPEGGAERNVCYYRHHNCGTAKALKAAGVLDEDGDLLQFTIGLQGEGMPANIPFEVVSSNSCGGCGKAFRAMAVWVAPRIWTP